MRPPCYRRWVKTPRRTLSLLPLLVSVLLAASCAVKSAFTKADRTAITQLLVAQGEAWNRGDLDGFMDGYARTPDLVFTSGSMVRRGWEETRAKYQARYGSDPSTMGHLDLEVQVVQALGADGAVVLGRWTLTQTPEAGSGVFSVVFERQAATWKVVRDHTSSDAKH